MPKLAFLRQFVTHPGDIGAMFETSQVVARHVAELACVREAKTVVEWGAGTGAVTGAIVDALPKSGKLLAFEINPAFCRLLGRRFPNIRVVKDSAVLTKQYLRDAGVERCDAIISGLPFAGFDETTQNALLDVIVESLRPGGAFVTFGYAQLRLLPGGRKIRAKLEERFKVVEKTPTIWRNIPPAFAYRVFNPPAAA
ncbi:MAG: methyltransferase domain-containing protein [Candidatus Hydrogenedentota bacterium]